LIRKLSFAFNALTDDEIEKAHGSVKPIRRDEWPASDAQRKSFFRHEAPDAVVVVLLAKVLLPANPVSRFWLQVGVMTIGFVSRNIC